MTTPTPPEPSLPPDPQRRRLAGPWALAIEDFRSVRRWLILLGALAAVACAVAVYALIQAQESEEEAADRDRVLVLERTLVRRLAEVDRRLERAGEESDIEKIERRLRRASEESDVAKLDRRLRRVEDDVTDAVDGAADAGRAVSRLEDRVEGLSRQISALRRR